jgi:O-succinylbenzoic acid--CoA ligase
MEYPLTLLQHRSRENWLIGYNTQKLANLAVQRYQELLQYDSPAVLLADRDPINFIAGFIAACSAPCHIFLCNPDWRKTEWQQVFEQINPTIIWADIKPPQCSSVPSIRPSVDHLIMIPTGGTSGRIRFAMHTWETLTTSVEGFRQYFEVDHVNSWCVLPLYHVSGLMQLMRSLTSNGKLILQPWKALESPQKTAHLNPTDVFLSLVPTQLQRLTHRMDWLATFKTILLGGAPTWENLLQEARSKQIAIAPTYGMTETASQIATLKPQDFLTGQSGCGPVLPHANISIHPETGKLSIQAKSLMLGYYPTLSNSNRYEPDDLGYFDDRGFLHILGRNSHKIITGGENVFPAEVEAAIRATQLVKDVCVMGLPDSTWGQIVTAIYVPKDTNEQELVDEIAPLLTKFKQPKRWIAIAEIPRNAQGKINRDRLLDIINRPSVPTLRRNISSRHFS